MIDSHADCPNCEREGYDECLCSFCSLCGRFRHSRDICSFAPCPHCDEKHPATECPSIEYPTHLLHSRRTPLSGVSGTSSPWSSESSTQDCNTTHTPVTKTTIHSYQRKDLGVVDRAAILRHLMTQVREKYNQRYAILLDAMNVGIALEEKLSPAVRNICEKGNFTLSSLIALGGQPEQSEETGVYLHILWQRNMPNCFWLYVGQANQLCVRISTHNNPYRRERQRSLHYAVWNSTAEMESVFVTLATQSTVTTARDQLLLNMQEMWMSLIFQTLRGIHLDEFLPEGPKSLWAGSHLNVALPLWQGFTAVPNIDAIGGRVGFQEYLFDNNPLIRQWAENLRDAFNDIRNSPDPELRQYYHDLHTIRLHHVQETWERKKRDALREYLSGKNAAVTESQDRYSSTIAIGSYYFTVSRRLGLEFRNGDEVLVRFELSKTPHPCAYAIKARDDDPACRFAVSIRGRVGNSEYCKWLTTKGDLNVKKINSLVDVLEGCSREESASFKRRWQVRRAVPGQRASRGHMYT